MPPRWVIQLIALGVLIAACYFAVQRVRAWHDAYEELPTVKRSLDAELACEKGSTCDKKAEERANKAAAEAALAASTAVSGALAAEEAARREAAAWRARFKDARGASVACDAWANMKVECPL